MSGGQARIARHIDLIDLPPPEKIRLRRLIPAIHKEKTRIYSDLITTNAVKPRPGVARLIEEARRANLPVGLVASSASSNVDSIVTSALGRSLRNAVIAIACSDMVARKKPSPDIYELALSMLRASATNSVAFEDSTNGMLAARAVGIFTVITPSPWTALHKFNGAELVLSSLGDPEKPLEGADAAKIGARYLDLSKIEKLKFGESPSLKLSDA
jgi:HAD superfamily hydrolase (TIGR01509 family)